MAEEAGSGPDGMTRWRSAGRAVGGVRISTDGPDAPTPGFCVSSWMQRGSAGSLAQIRSFQPLTGIFARISHLWAARWLLPPATRFRQGDGYGPVLCVRGRRGMESWQRPAPIELRKQDSEMSMQKTEKYLVTGGRFLCSSRRRGACTSAGNRLGIVVSHPNRTRRG